MVSAPQGIGALALMVSAPQEVRGPPQGQLKNMKVCNRVRTRTTAY